MFAIETHVEKGRNKRDFEPLIDMEIKPKYGNIWSTKIAKTMNKLT